MRSLILGGAGFIGSHLIDRLLAIGHEVICVDNLLTGSRENIVHHKDNQKFRFIEHDIVSPLFINEPIDEIYNLACPGSPLQYQKNPIGTIKANTIGMINMLGLARAHGARLLQASTSEIYGDPAVHPQPETYRGNVSSIGPRACYDEGKRCAETLCFDYYRAHAIPIKVVRIFNTYGPRMAFEDGRVISNFLVQALKGEPITIFGDGSQTRSFCYVSDLVEGLIRMMQTKKTVTGPINIGNAQEYTILSLAKKIQAVTNSTSLLVFRPLPEDDPTRRCPDTILAKKSLKWSPSVDLDTGLASTIENFRARLVV